MKRRLTIISSAVVLLLAVSGARGMEPISDDATTETGPETGSVVLITETGTVVSSSGGALVIRTDAGEEKTFVVDAYSDVPATLTAGALVTVESQALADGRHQVTRVTTGGAGGVVPDTGTVPMPTGTSTSAQELPGTASPLLLLGLAGIVAIGGGLGLRRAFRGKPYQDEEVEQ